MLVVFLACVNGMVGRLVALAVLAESGGASVGAVVEGGVGATVGAVGGIGGVGELEVAACGVRAVGEGIAVRGGLGGGVGCGEGGLVGHGGWGSERRSRTASPGV